MLRWCELLQPLPREPLPDTSHLDAARAPGQVAERQARAYGSPLGDAYPPALVNSGAAAPHGAPWQASIQRPRYGAAADVAALQRPAPGSSPGTPHGSSLAWGIPAHDPWHGGPQRPHTARPSRGIGDAGLASPEAILLATQVRGCTVGSVCGCVVGVVKPGNVVADEMAFWERGWQPLLGPVDQVALCAWS